MTPKAIEAWLDKHFRSWPCFDFNSRFRNKVLDLYLSCYSTRLNLSFCVVRSFAAIFWTKAGQHRQQYQSQDTWRRWDSQRTAGFQLLFDKADNENTTHIYHAWRVGMRNTRSPSVPGNNTGKATLNFRKHNPFSQPRSKLECPPRFDGDDVCAHEKIKQQDTLSAAGLKSAVIFPPAIFRRGRWHQVEGHSLIL